MKHKNFLDVLTELIERYKYVNIAEGRRRERLETKEEPFTPKTDEELLREVFEQMGWENILGDDPK